MEEADHDSVQSAEVEAADTQVSKQVFASSHAVSVSSELPHITPQIESLSNDELALFAEELNKRIVEHNHPDVQYFTSKAIRSLTFSSADEERAAVCQMCDELQDALASVPFSPFETAAATLSTDSLSLFSSACPAHADNMRDESDVENDGVSVSSLFESCHSEHSDTSSEHALCAEEEESFDCPCVNCRTNLSLSHSSLSTDTLNMREQTHASLSADTLNIREHCHSSLALKTSADAFNVTEQPTRVIVDMDTQCSFSIFTRSVVLPALVREWPCLSKYREVFGQREGASTQTRGIVHMTFATTGGSRVSVNVVGNLTSNEEVGVLMHSPEVSRFDGTALVRSAGGQFVRVQLLPASVADGLYPFRAAALGDLSEETASRGHSDAVAHTYVMAVRETSEGGESKVKPGQSKEAGTGNGS
jgi:hypothetical protein